LDDQHSSWTYGSLPHTLSHIYLNLFCPTGCGSIHPTKNKEERAGLGRLRRTERRLGVCSMGLEAEQLGQARATWSASCHF